MRGVALAGGIAMGALALLGGPAQASGGGGIVAHASPPSKGSYWTQARMRRAEPRRLPAVEPAAAKHPGPVRQGRAGRIPPVAPQSSSKRGVPPGYGTFGVSDPTNGFWRVNGKVFGRDRLFIYECSAVVVGSGRRSVIFTAGHCVHTRRGGWARRLTFFPAFDHGERPFGGWDFHKAFAPRPYVRHGNENYDYAAVSMKRKPRGSLQRVVGAAGFAWNQPRNQDYRAIGYPGNYSNGLAMISCFQPFVRNDHGGAPGRAAVGIRCGNLGEGSSGGGWLTDDEFVTSVTAYGLLRQPNILYGPYFNRMANRLRRAAAHS